MKLDELISEYRDCLPAGMPGDFEFVLRREQIRRRWRWSAALAGLAAAACLAFMLFKPVKTEPAPVVVQGFVAIEEMATLPAPESWQVMRVSVSSPRLVALGVVAPHEAVTETMLADVLFGGDGMARAIRVVDQE